MLKFIGVTDRGSTPGSFSGKDWGKWLQTTLYVVGSAMVIGGLNKLSEIIAGIDWSSFSITVFDMFEINGTMIGMGVANLIAYLIALILKDTR